MKKHWTQKEALQKKGQFIKLLPMSLIYTHFEITGLTQAPPAKLLVLCHEARVQFSRFVWAQASQTGPFRVRPLWVSPLGDITCKKNWPDSCPQTNGESPQKKSGVQS